MARSWTELGRVSLPLDVKLSKLPIVNKNVNETIRHLDVDAQQLQAPKSVQLDFYWVYEIAE